MECCRRVPPPNVRAPLRRAFASLVPPRSAASLCPESNTSVAYNADETLFTCGEPKVYCAYSAPSARWDGSAWHGRGRIGDGGKDSQSGSRCCDLRHGRKLECVRTLLLVIHFELREMVKHLLLVLVPALLLLEPIQYPTVVPLVGSVHSPCMCRMLVNLLTAPDLP